MQNIVLVGRQSDDILRCPSLRLSLCLCLPLCQRALAVSTQNDDAVRTLAHHRHDDAVFARSKDLPVDGVGLAYQSFHLSDRHPSDVDRWDMRQRNRTIFGDDDRIAHRRRQVAVRLRQSERYG